MPPLPPTPTSSVAPDADAARLRRLPEAIHAARDRALVLCGELLDQVGDTVVKVNDVNFDHPGSALSEVSRLSARVATLTSALTAAAALSDLANQCPVALGRADQDAAGVFTLIDRLPRDPDPDMDAFTLAATYDPDASTETLSEQQMRLRAAARAATAVVAFMARHDDTEESFVADLIADLGHMCDRVGFDFEELLDRGRGYCRCETSGGVITEADLTGE